MISIDGFLRSRKYQEEWVDDLYSSIFKKGSYYFLPIALEGPQIGAECGESQHLINLPHSACDQELAGNFLGSRPDDKEGDLVVSVFSDPALSSCSRQPGKKGDAIWMLFLENRFHKIRKKQSIRECWVRVRKCEFQLQHSNMQPCWNFPLLVKELQLQPRPLLQMNK